MLPIQDTLCMDHSQYLQLHIYQYLVLVFLEHFSKCVVWKKHTVIYLQTDDFEEIIESQGLAKEDNKSSHINTHHSDCDNRKGLSEYSKAQTPKC